MPLRAATRFDSAKGFHMERDMTVISKRPDVLCAIKESANGFFSWVSGDDVVWSRGVEGEGARRWHGEPKATTVCIGGFSYQMRGWSEADALHEILESGET